MRPGIYYADSLPHHWLVLTHETIDTAYTDCLAVHTGAGHRPLDPVRVSVPTETIQELHAQLPQGERARIMALAHAVETPEGDQHGHSDAESRVAAGAVYPPPSGYDAASLSQQFHHRAWEWDAGYRAELRDSSPTLPQAEGPAPADRFEEILGELRDLHRRKGHDYGDNLSAVAELGLSPLLGILVRMSDKWRRIANLTHTGAPPRVADETLSDTLRDLASYAILALVETEKPRADD